MYLKFCDSIRSSQNRLRRISSKFSSFLVLCLCKQFLESLHNLLTKNGDIKILQKARERQYRQVIRQHATSRRKRKKVLKHHRMPMPCIVISIFHLMRDALPQILKLSTSYSRLEKNAKIVEVLGPNRLSIQRIKRINWLYQNVSYKHSLVYEKRHKKSFNFSSPGSLLRGDFLS